MPELPIKSGKRYYYKKLMYWAENGCICIEDLRDGDFRMLTSAEFAARLITIRAVLDSDRNKFSDERNQDWNFLVQGCDCIREAKQQGDMFDPAVMNYLKRHRHKSFSLGVGTGQEVDLFTVSQADAPEQKSLLPPLGQYTIKNKKEQAPPG
jgi:hypothetical protein